MFLYLGKTGNKTVTLTSFIIVWDQEEKAETIAIKSIQNLDLMTITYFLLFSFYTLYLRPCNDLLFIKCL